MDMFRKEPVYRENKCPSEIFEVSLPPSTYSSPGFPPVNVDRR
jgi:hypothetical protein